MMDFLMESVVISFTLGGVMGVVITMHLAPPPKVAVKVREETGQVLEHRTDFDQI